jgi:hypothetical protein
VLVKKGMGKKFWTPQSPVLWHTGGGGPPPAGPARVQGKIVQNGSNNINTVTVPLDAAVAPGNTVAISVGSPATPDRTVSIFDDKGNIPTLADAIYESVSSYGWITYYLIGIANSPQIFTMTFFDPNPFNTMIVEEYSGVSAIDVHTMESQISPAVGADAISSGAAVTTSAGDLIVASTVNVNGTGTTLTPGSGFAQGLAFGIDFMTEYRIQSVAGSIAGTFGFTGATSTYVTSIMAFKHA